jgi:agmatinase
LHTVAPLDLPADPGDAVESIAATSAPHFEAGRFVLGLGGEHSVTVGLLKGLNRPSVGILQLDAHADLRAEYDGTPFSHACVMRRAVEMGHACVGVGIRSHSPEEAAWMRASDYPVFYAHTLDVEAQWIDAVVERLPEEVYLTLDVDALDPSILPGTGTPEPDGMTYRQVVRLIDAVAARRRIVGADIVELAPFAGSQVSEFTAARLALRILAATQ